MHMIWYGYLLCCVTSIFGEFGISFIVNCSAILLLCRHYPVVSDGGNWSTNRKSPPNSRSLAIFSHIWGIDIYDKYDVHVDCVVLHNVSMTNI